jgi:UDP-glucuronate 4-epimerase
MLLITGCAGFIGSTATDYFLSNGHRVIGIDNFDSFYDRGIKERNMIKALQNPGFTFHELDLTDPSALGTITEKPNTVIHLAAKAGVRPSIENPAAYIQSNIGATYQVLEWMRNRGVPNLLFASSSSIYGNNKKTPFSETDLVDHPISPYAFSKKSCELLIHTYHHLYNINAVNLRFFTVYGERQRPDLAIRKFTAQILKNELITLFGNGESSRDYTYIHDIIQGIDGALKYIEQNKNVYEIINLGGNTPIVLKDLVEELYKQLQREPNLVFGKEQAGDVERTYADILKAKQLLNYNPQTQLSEGLGNFISWYKKQDTQN